MIASGTTASSRVFLPSLVSVMSHFFEIKCLWADVPWLLSLLSIIIGCVHRCIFQRLTVIRTSKPPHDVLHGCLVQVLLQVMESMLRHVSQSHVLVPPDLTRLRFQLSNQQLDCCRFASSVGTHNSDTGCHARSETDLPNRVLLVAWIFEGDVIHLHDGTAT